MQNSSSRGRSTEPSPPPSSPDSRSSSRVESRRAHSLRARRATEVAMHRQPGPGARPYYSLLPRARAGLALVIPSTSCASFSSQAFQYPLPRDSALPASNVVHIRKTSRKSPRFGNLREPFRLGKSRQAEVSPRHHITLFFLQRLAVLDAMRTVPLCSSSSCFHGVAQHGFFRDSDARQALVFSPSQGSKRTM